MALDNVTFTKALVGATSQEFKDRIGEVTAKNMHKVGEIITDYPTAKNEFVNVLTNQVAKQRFFSKAYENPYKLFKKGMLPYGKSIESIFVDIVKGKDRTRQTDGGQLATDLLSRQNPNVKVEYYSENKQMQYQATISDEELKGAFREENGLSNLTSRILQAPLNSAEYDDFLLVKHALSHLKGAEVKLGKTAYDKLTLQQKAQSLVTAIKSYILKMGFLSNQYNGQGVMTYSKPQDLVCFVPTDLLAVMDVQLLAQAFNVSYDQINLHVLPIDYFESCTTSDEGSTYEYAEDTETQCIICDKEALQIWETLNSSETFRNPQALYTNVWFNRWGIVASCNFVNCVKFVVK
jgi:hypothetical protein